MVSYVAINISCMVMKDNILGNIRSKQKRCRPRRPKNRHYWGYLCPKIHEIGEKYQLIAFTMAVSSFFWHTLTRYDWICITLQYAQIQCSLRKSPKKAFLLGVARFEEKLNFLDRSWSRKAKYSPVLLDIKGPGNIYGNTGPGKLQRDHRLFWSFSWTGPPVILRVDSTGPLLISE